MSSGMILTESGRNILAKALTGRPLVFTRAFCGDGQLGSRDAAKLTALISPKRELPIQSMNVASGVGTCEVVLEMTNKGLTQGFFVREYGLYARDPDGGNEVLYAYRNTGNEAGYLEGENGVDLISYTLSIVTVVDQASNISAVIQNSNQYVTFSRLEQHTEDLFGDFQEAQGFWSYERNGEHRFRPATLEQTKRALWGDADVTGFNSRIERLEDAVNQTMLALEILQEYPGFSHYMAEDFNNTDQLDMFAGEVTSIVAGDDSIDIRPLDGMLPGSWYTISDGVNSESVRVQSINLENGIQRVILTEPIKNTYILENTQIYRTSSRIDNSTAIGPNARIKISWEPDFVWRGTGETETFKETLNTYLNNAKAYSFSGGAVLDNNGLATLSN